MRRRSWLPAFALLGLLALLLAACAPAATPAEPSPGVGPTQPASSEGQTQTRPAATVAPAPTGVPIATTAPSGTNAAGAADTQGPPPTPTAAVNPTSPATAPAPTDSAEARLVELEWPTRMRLGDSEGVRLALIPSAGGYTATVEFPDNTVITQAITISQIGGYTLYGVARLDGVGFQIAPAAEQVVPLPLGEPVVWRWTLTPRSAGQHRLTVDLRLRWVGATTRETQVYSKALTVDVLSFLGLSIGQAMWFGVLGLMVGGGASVAAFTVRLRPRPERPRPNTALALDAPPGLAFSAHERTLLQALFRRYARVVVESEFRSGYSGARTLLALPVRADGRADAPTIVKLGQRRAIEREHDNYTAYVKDTLPPMTARVQEALVDPRAPMAALRYTFIAEPGQRPMSLREALLKQPDPALLARLFETFGPNWWLQRRAHTFRLAQEYDRLLPAHLVLEPLAGSQPAVAKLTAETAPSSLAVGVDAVVRVGRFPEVEARPDGQSLSLTGRARPGEPPLRARWLGLRPPDNTLARVTGTRATLLQAFVAGLDLGGLPDPLARLPAVLAEAVAGSQSTIHGDLNLENVLVGPGGFVWLIDFERTRDGHPLFDFAHLQAEIIAHVVAPQVAAASAYLDLWTLARSQPAGAPSGLGGLLAALPALAARCLANPAQPREYDLALYLACLGALKYPTLDAHARHCLYLTAAHLARTL